MSTFRSKYEHGTLCWCSGFLDLYRSQFRIWSRCGQKHAHSFSLGYDPYLDCFFLCNAAHAIVTVQAVKEVATVVDGVRPLNVTFGVCQLKDLLKDIFISNGNVDRLGEGPLGRIQRWFPPLLLCGVTVALAVWAEMSLMEPLGELPLMYIGLRLLKRNSESMYKKEQGNMSLCIVFLRI